MHCSSKKLERKSREATDKCLLVLNESNKRGFHTYIHLIYNLYSPYMQPIFTYMHLICNLYTLYSQPIFTIYTLFTTYIHLCKPYSQTIFTYIRHILTIFNNYPSSPNDSEAIQPICYGNRAEWSPIRSVIIRVINKIG